MVSSVGVFKGAALAAYHFGESHPFGPKRLDAFVDALPAFVASHQFSWLETHRASQAQLALFHSADYLKKVRFQSKTGVGFLDGGDTPSFPGVFEVAADVVGASLRAIDYLLEGRFKRVFSPIGGLHHARREHAAGFCVFNDCGVAIEYLRHQYAIQRIAYVDFDAHHGDGVFYSFDDDADLCFVDFHQDGHSLYPGSGFADESGVGPGAGLKLNIPLPPFADDALFFDLWPKALAFVRDFSPELILVQCGADCVAGDPITQLALSERVHARVVADLCAVADDTALGRLLAWGGGGYNLANIARAWPSVVKALCAS